MPNEQELNLFNLMYLKLQKGNENGNYHDRKMKNLTHYQNG